jgi:hypothetical protein
MDTRIFRILFRIPRNTSEKVHQKENPEKFQFPRINGFLMLTFFGAFSFFKHIPSDLKSAFAIHINLFSEQNGCY